MSSLVVVGCELGAVALGCGLLYLVARLAIRAIPTTRPEWRRAARSKSRELLTASLAALVVLVIGGNAYLVLRGLDPESQTLALLRSLTTTLPLPLTIAIAVAKLTLAVGAFLLAARLLHRLLRRAEEKVMLRAHFDGAEHSIHRLVRRFERAILNLGWILLTAYGSAVLASPRGTTELLLLVARVYGAAALGLLVVRSTPTIVAALDTLGRRQAGARQWLGHYDRLRWLLPTVRTCLEYALWIGVGSFVLYQWPSTQGLAAWGPRLIQTVGILLGGRVLIGLGHLEIEHRMLPREGLDDTERRRRATMVPLVRSAFTYAVYFGTAALMLSVLGFNPMPFLAGAGLLGVVVGFGAQSLINDVVSGFFILLENIYLVGDMVEVGAARGVVESIEFRTTKIRDGEGRVHIIRNGDMKPVINYSKDYTMAVVTMEVDYDADLPAVFAQLRRAGARLRGESRDVLDETQIDGITAFGASSMTVRTSTRVLPGRHEAVAAMLRLMIKETQPRQAGRVGVRPPVTDPAPVAASESLGARA